MTEARCNSCRWWHETGGTPVGMGRCRIDPPQTASQGGQGSSWPMTSGNSDWCSHHHWKESEEEQAARTRAATAGLGLDS
jgi:hypothetical protein